MSSEFFDIYELLIKRVKKPSQKAVQYVFDSRGKLFGEAVKEYIERDFDDIKTSRILEVVQSMNSVLSSLISKDLDRRFEEVQTEIRQKALTANFPIGSGRRGGGHLFTEKVLYLDDFEKNDAIRECFRWIDFSMEFCLGKSLFRKDEQILEGTLAPRSETPPENPEENIIFQFWKQGYLSCDLKR